MSPEKRVEIMHGGLLPRRAELVRKVQVLLPADDGIVRAAVGKIDAAVAQLDRQRRELLLARVVHQLAVAVQQHPAEAHGVRHAAHEVGDAPRDQHAHVDLLPVMAGEVGSRSGTPRPSSGGGTMPSKLMKLNSARIRPSTSLNGETVSGRSPRQSR